MPRRLIKHKRRAVAHDHPTAPAWRIYMNGAPWRSVSLANAPSRCSRCCATDASLIVKRAITATGLGMPQLGQGANMAPLDALALARALAALAHLALSSRVLDVHTDVLIRQRRPSLAARLDHGAALPHGPCARSACGVGGGAAWRTADDKSGTKWPAAAARQWTPRPTQRRSCISWCLVEMKMKRPTHGVAASASSEASEEGFGAVGGLFGGILLHLSLRSRRGPVRRT